MALNHVSSVIWIVIPHIAQRLVRDLVKGVALCAAWRMIGSRGVRRRQSRLFAGGGDRGAGY
jgi:hypothetical protein